MKASVFHVENGSSGSGIFDKTPVEVGIKESTSRNCLYEKPKIRIILKQKNRLDFKLKYISFNMNPTKNMVCPKRSQLSQTVVDLKGQTLEIQVDYHHVHLGAGSVGLEHCIGPTYSKIIAKMCVCVCVQNLHDFLLNSCSKSVCQRLGSYAYWHCFSTNMYLQKSPSNFHPSAPKLIPMALIIEISFIFPQ